MLPSHKLLELISNQNQKNLLINLTTLEILDSVLETTTYLDLYDANVEEEQYRLENIKEFPFLPSFLNNLVVKLGREFSIT